MPRDRRTTHGARIFNRRLRVEPLEDRRMLAALFVNSLSDNSVVGDGLVTLREAIVAANTDVATDLGDVASGADSIEFSAALIESGPRTIQLSHGNIDIKAALAIHGPGAALLTVDASGNDPTPTVNNGDGSRLFFVDDETINLVDVEIAGLSLTGGDVAGDGGAILAFEKLTIADCIVRDNAGYDGGGVAGYRNLQISNSVISGNIARRVAGSFDPYGGYGGGVLGQNLVMTGTTVKNNTSYLGGGVDSSSATIDGCNITGNSATRGGGIFNSAGNSDATMHISNSTIASNTATSSGGGIHIAITLGPTEIIENSTISQNVAPNGAGVQVAGKLNIRFSTITGNRASNEGGGILCVGSLSSTHIELDSTIVAGNFGKDVDLLGSTNKVFSTGYNLIGGGEAVASFNQPGDQTGVNNPGLAPLAYNGGALFLDGSPMLTHALLTGSPAIDAGRPEAIAGVGTTPIYDQRGAPFGRLTNGDATPATVIDIGAIERQPIPAAIFGDYNHDQVVNAADYTVWRNTLHEVGMAYSGADGDGDGVVDDDDYFVWKSHLGQTVPAAGVVADIFWSEFGQSSLQQTAPAAVAVNSNPKGLAPFNPVVDTWRVADREFRRPADWTSRLTASSDCAVLTRPVLRRGDEIASAVSKATADVALTAGGRSGDLVDGLFEAHRCVFAALPEKFSPAF